MAHVLRMVVSSLFGLLLALTAFPPASATAQQARLCFAEVPDCIEGRFAEYWRQNGGLPVFGYPIGPARLESVGGGQFLVQPFERNRFELHPENARPYDVLLGRLGVDRLAALGRPWESQPKAPAPGRAGCQYFGETQHLVCDQFLRYWSSNGLSLDGRAGFSAAESLALFGLPITEAAVETGSDGKPYLTQWFERARFELHPELGPNVVLLGLLGRESGAPVAQPPTADSCADVPEPVNARIRPAKCFAAGTQAAVDVFGFRPNEQVGLWINAPDGSVVGTVQTFSIGPTGAANDIPIDSGDLPPGMWSLVIEGTSSGHKAIAYFKLTGAAAQPPATAACEGVPDPVNGRVRPGKCFAAGTEMLIDVFGFRPNEQVGFWFNAPDGSIYGTVQSYDIGPEGAVSDLPFDTSDLEPGVWSFVMEGTSSGHKAIIYFRIR